MASRNQNLVPAIKRRSLQHGTKRRQRAQENHNFDKIDLPLEIRDALLSNGLPAEPAVVAAKALRHTTTTNFSAVARGIDDIDHEIERLVMEKRGLYKKLWFHGEVLRACNTVLAPIRYIPWDVIQEIANHAMDEYPSGSTRNAPVSLARVSSTWRTVVLSSPRLWTSLYLVIRLSELEDFAKYALLVQEWFKRAKGLPFKFYFYVDGELGDPAKFKAFLEEISPCMSSVRHLGIGSHISVEALRCFTDITSWKLDALEIVDLQGWKTMPLHPSLDDPSGLFVTLFHKANSLTTVISEDYMICPTNMGSWTTIFPWSQLTCASFSREFNVLEWIKVLESLPRLQKGAFRIYEQHQNVDIDQYLARNRTHHHIESLFLEIKVLPTIPLIGILQIFNLPKLVKLGIKSRNSNQDPLSLRSPIGVKQLASLQSLFLSGLSDFPTEYIEDLLSQTVNLRKLSMMVYANADFDRLIQYMAFTKSHGLDARDEDAIPNVLTQLTDLYICCPDRLQPIDISILSAMLHSRCEDVPIDCEPLKKFNLSGLWGAKLFPEIERKLKDLNLDVEIDLPHHPPPLREPILSSAFGGWNPRGRPWSPWTPWS